MTDVSPAQQKSTGVAAPFGDGSTPVWVQTSWDHRWAEDLRGQMDAELGPRYRAFVEQGHPRPLPPRAEDIATVWVAVIDDRPAATAALLRTPDYWEVKRVYVSPEFRRRALARQTLAHVEEVARSLGVQDLVLQTGILQPEAIALYSRQGWNRVPAFGPYVGDDVSVCFRKGLD